MCCTAWEYEQVTLNQAGLRIYFNLLGDLNFYPEIQNMKTPSRAEKHWLILAKKIYIKIWTFIIYQKTANVFFFLRCAHYHILTDYARASITVLRIEHPHTTTYSLWFWQPKGTLKP